MKVPFLDLKAQYDTIKEEIAVAIQSVLDKTAFAGGPFVAKFEEEFATFCGTKHALGVGSGTDALWLALAGLGVGAGDEVITVPNTFIATTEAISYRGATPVFVDVDPKTWLMDPAKLESAITPKTKAILPVHLFGQMCDMDPIMAIAKKHNLFVVEDACQAHGATYKGRMAGSIGDAAAFSFYPGKNLGAYGEAGGMVTNNDEVAAKARMLRDHGQAKKYYHSMIGWNMRMDGIQGAILSVKLKHIKQWNEARHRNAKLYDELLAGIPGVVTPSEADYGKAVYHIYAICVKDRDAVIAKLAEKDVHCGIHYPVPLHLQEAYAFLGKGQGSFPVAEKGASEYVSLPMYAELNIEQIQNAVDHFKLIISEPMINR
ncbi:MAG TPA: DegT/DnrJ/EryC1/StrS family aminotransferase [Candidatus Deferrimicrobiaceae bacterium]|jgi:dTDP-4-amino-4,6-dideoxygalactose transaminase